MDNNQLKSHCPGFAPLLAVVDESNKVIVSGKNSMVLYKALNIIFLHQDTMMKLKELPLSFCDLP
jgi:hypothetical protein